MARVSVLLPTFNRPGWLKASVESVLAQSGVDLELLILDNGSGEETGALLRTITDPRVQCYRFEKNNESNAYEFLAARATGDYCVWWTDDDVMLPGNLELKAKCLDISPDAGFCWGPAQEINTLGEKCGPGKQGGKGDKIIWQAAAPFDVLYQHNFICMPSAMFRRQYIHFWSIAKDFGVYADWFFWLCLSRVSDQVYLPGITIQLRLHDGSDSCVNGTRGGEFMRRAEQVWKYWAREGHVPTTDDLDVMRLCYLAVAMGQFAAIRQDILGG